MEGLLPVVDYATETGCGVLLVEQHIQLALGVADRGYVLSHGEVVLQDRAEALRRNRELLMASYSGRARGERAARASLRSQSGISQSGNQRVMSSSKGSSAPTWPAAARARSRAPGRPAPG